MQTNINEGKPFPSQPKALYILFFAELWERFSYYGLRVLLILYLTSELKLSDANAYGIYGMYFTLANASTVLGGYLADRYLGHLKAICWGSLIIIAGHLILFVPSSHCLTLGLSFVITGTGFFKANVTSLLGQCYQNNDSRRDSGFTIFYMGINLGAFIAPFICGYLGRKYGWHYGFGISGIGMFIGLMILLWHKQTLEKIGQFQYNSEIHQPYFLKFSRYQLIIASILLSIPVFNLCLQYHEKMANFLYIFGIGVLCVILGIIFKSSKEERKPLLTLMIMFPFFTAFWASFEQAGASISLFIERHVDRQFMNYTVETTWFQSLTPMLILALGPLFSFLWMFLRKYKIEPLTPIKFALALMQVSLSFWFLKKGVEEGFIQGTTYMMWILLAYFFRTSGELCISPVGLSMVTKLAPQRLMGFMMSILFLSVAFAQFIAQRIASYFSSIQEISKLSQIHDKAISLNTFGQIFEFLIYFPFIAAMVMLAISPFLKDIFKKHQ